MNPTDNSEVAAIPIRKAYLSIHSKPTAYRFAHAFGTMIIGSGPVARDIQRVNFWGKSFIFKYFRLFLQGYTPPTTACQRLACAAFPNESY